jgi:hypothetical protein
MTDNFAPKIKKFNILFGWYLSQLYVDDIRSVVQQLLHNTVLNHTSEDVGESLVQAKQGISFLFGYQSTYSQR